MRTESRTVSLSETTWELLDRACEERGDITPSMLLEYFVQDYLRHDDDTAVRNASALADLEKLFGNNHG